MNIETLKNLVIEKKKIFIPIGSILILLLILVTTGKLDDLLGVIATITIAISGVVGALLIFICCLIPYCLPIIIGINRKHSNLTPIILVTLFLGWTGIGWLVALIWAFTDNTISKERR
jgi:hypothetical protein